MQETAHSPSALKSRILSRSGILAATLAILLAVTVSEAAELHLTESAGGVSVELTISKDRTEIPDKLQLTVDPSPIGKNPAPNAIRVRTGMPEHGHWLGEAVSHAYQGQPLTFTIPVTMEGAFRIRIWLVFEDGENNIGIDFDAPGPLSAHLIAPLPPSEGTARPPHPSTEPVNLDIPALTGASRLSLASLRGKPVWLAYWASWCRPCRAELPELAKIRDRFEPKGIKFVLISLDKDPEAARRFLATIKVDIPSYIDESGESVGFFDAKNLPLNVILNEDGTVKTRHEGLLPNLAEWARTELGES